MGGLGGTGGDTVAAAGLSNSVMAALCLGIGH